MLSSPLSIRPVAHLASSKSAARNAGLSSADPVCQLELLQSGSTQSLLLIKIASLNSNADVFPLLSLIQVEPKNQSEQIS
jgi:hypothetical protein